MKNLKIDCFNPFFSHIYVETSVWNHPRTKAVLAKFPSAKIIKISHYKDVFCRARQSCVLQRHSQNLILAKKEGTLVYQGAKVCQSFGNEFFYYTSCMMNCIYDCEYCYLKLMYPSSNIVIFVNIEDIFAQLEQMLAVHPLYVCVSYDTDLLAMEQVMGYAKEWCRFAARQAGRLNIEIRTKCANQKYFQNQKYFMKRKPLSDVIYAFTLSPQEIIEAYEKYTPSFTQRIECAKEAVRMGFSVRLCFDPMIYVNGWQRCYGAMLDKIFQCMDMEKLVDVSVGTFRISQDYLKKMRRQEPDSAIAWFPYQNDQGVYHYPDRLMKQMECFLTERLEKYLPKEKIFLWKD